MSCSRRPRSAAGLTLIEVVAGLALMATILSSLLYARLRFARNLALADARLTAVAAANSLLNEWTAAGKPVPSAASGEVSSQPRLRWQTRLINDDDARRAQSRVVRLTIVRADAATRDATMLASVDVLEPAKPATGGGR